MNAMRSRTPPALLRANYVKAAESGRVSIWGCGVQWRQRSGSVWKSGSTKWKVTIWLECVCVLLQDTNKHRLRAIHYTRAANRARKTTTRSQRWLAVISLNCAPHFFSLQRRSNGTRGISRTPWGMVFGLWPARALIDAFLHHHLTPSHLFIRKWW